jgi:hypothetical protein
MSQDRYPAHSQVGQSAAAKEAPVSVRGHAEQRVTARAGVKLQPIRREPDEEATLQRQQARHEQRGASYVRQQPYYVDFPVSCVNRAQNARGRHW